MYSLSKQKNNNNFLSNKQTFIILLIFQCLILAFVLIFCCIKYEVSDDFIVELLLSGGYSGQINWHMPFSNPILGIFLGALYKLISRSVSWYFLMLLFVGFASYISISWVFAHKNNKILGITVTILLTMATAGDVYILPQFTKTAAVAITAGCILFLYGLFSARKIIPVFLGTMLTIVGTFIRFRVLYSVAVPIIVIVIICLVKSFIEAEIKKKWLIKKIVPCTVFVILLFGLNILGNKIFTADSYYEYYREYNSARSRIVDYEHTDYSDFEDELWDLWISGNDYYLLTNWSFGDPDKFSLNMMNQVADILDQHRVQKEVTFENILEHINTRGYLSYPVVWVLILLAVICSVANWRKIWIPLLCIISSIFYIILFYSMGRYVYRVEFGFLFAAAAVIAWATDRERGSELEIIRVIICCALSCAAIGYMGVLWFPKTINQSDRSECRGNITEYLFDSWEFKIEKYSVAVQYGKPYENFTRLVENNPDNIYMMEFVTTIQTYYYNFSPFKSGSSVLPDNVFWISDVTTEFPSTLQWRDRHEYRSTIKALLNDNVYYVGNKLADSILIYLRWNGCPDVTMELVDKIDGYNIYKFYGELIED